MRKNGSKKDLPALPPSEFFMFVLLLSNHTVFLSFSLKLICTCEFFKKLKLHELLFEKLTCAN